MSDRPQRALLSDYIDDMPEPVANHRSLSEALYTASETEIFEFNIDSELAILIWKIVEFSKTATEEQIEEIRM